MKKKNWIYPLLIVLSLLLSSCKERVPWLMAPSELGTALLQGAMMTFVLAYLLLFPLLALWTKSDRRLEFGNLSKIHALLIIFVSLLVPNFQKNLPNSFLNSDILWFVPHLCVCIVVSLLIIRSWIKPRLRYSKINQIGISVTLVLMLHAIFLLRPNSFFSLPIMIIWVYASYLVIPISGLLLFIILLSWRIGFAYRRVHSFSIAPIVGFYCVIIPIHLISLGFFDQSYVIRSQDVKTYYFTWYGIAFAFLFYLGLLYEAWHRSTREQEPEYTSIELEAMNGVIGQMCSLLKGETTLADISVRLDCSIDEVTRLRNDLHRRQELILDNLSYAFNHLAREDIVPLIPVLAGPSNDLGDVHEKTRLTKIDVIELKEKIDKSFRLSVKYWLDNLGHSSGPFRRATEYQYEGIRPTDGESL